jgi:plasmid stabilization system protein ParE
MQQSGLGAEFHSEVSELIGRLAATPLIYQVAHKNIRRALVHRFPFLIWYRVIGKSVIVLACTHVKQDPDKTTVRLK